MFSLWQVNVAFLRGINWGVVFCGLNLQLIRLHPCIKLNIDFVHIDHFLELIAKYLNNIFFIFIAKTNWDHNYICYFIRKCKIQTPFPLVNSPGKGTSPLFVHIYRWRNQLIKLLHPHPTAVCGPGREKDARFKPYHKLGDLVSFGEIPYFCSGWHNKISIFPLYLARPHLKLFRTLSSSMHAQSTCNFNKWTWTHACMGNYASMTRCIF